MKAILPRLFSFVSAVLPTLAFAAATATVTPGTWDLYRGTSIVQRSLASEAACVNAAKALNVTRAYTCRTSTGVSVTVTIDPVNCIYTTAVSTSEWAPATCPVSGEQTRSITTTYTVTTPASGGGTACPANPTPVVETQPCTYVPPIDPPPSTGDVVQSPPTADLTVLQPGQTLILRDGAYTSLKLKAGTATGWVTAKAEHDGAVTFPAASLSFGPGNWYTSIEGVKFKGSTDKYIVGNYVALKRTAIEGGPSSGNEVTLQIGTNDYTPGASNILLEDVWVYGLGGRYKVLVYNSENVVLRRVVVRHDGGWAYDSRNPQGGFSLYDSRNVVCEDCLFVDSAANLDGFEAALYLVSNGTTSIKQSNVSVIGAALIGSPGNGLAAEGNGSAATYTVTDVLVSGSQAGGFNTNNAGHNLNVIRAKAKVTGYQFAKWASGGSLKVTGCATGSGPLNSGATLTSCPGGEGPRLDFRIGVDGTLFGQVGYTDVTAIPLFPWPNEARIKADFDSVRPAFGGKSLTEYVNAQK